MDKEKELILAEDEIMEVWVEWFPHQEFGLVKIDELKDYEKALIQAQHTKTKAHYKAEIKKIFAEIETASYSNISFIKLPIFVWQEIKSHYIEEGK